jgi:hypothetical protein
MTQSVWVRRRERLGEALSLILAVLFMGVGVVNAVSPQFLESRVAGLLLTAIGVLITISVWDRRVDREKYDIDRRDDKEKDRQIDDSLRKLEPLVSVAQSAVSADIVGLFPGRNDTQAQDAICKLLGEPGTRQISIAATALPAFFHPGKTYNGIVRRSLEHGVEFRVVLLDPRGQAAGQRAELEHAATTLKDIEGSIHAIQEYIGGNLPIEARLYNLPPQLYMLQTDSSVFVETYHFGRVLSGSTARPDPGCLGGRVPCYLARRNPGRESRDGVWDIMSDHFEYLWSGTYLDGQPLTVPIYSAVRIGDFRIEERSIAVTNGDLYTPISLAGWSLRATWMDDQKTRSRGTEILQFPEDLVLQPRERRVFETRLGRGLYTDLTFSGGAEGALVTPGRLYIEIINRIGKLAGRFPNDGFVIDQ